MSISSRLMTLAVRNTDTLIIDAKTDLAAGSGGSTASLIEKGSKGAIPARIAAAS